MTSAPPERLSPAQWLEFNRQAWGIENELHQRLDVSFGDDQCRVQSTAAIWTFGLFRRLANSLTVDWCQARHRRKHLTVSHFRTAMAANHGAAALLLLLNRHPSLKPRS